jgi:hypothetical protein
VGTNGGGAGANGGNGAIVVTWVDPVAVTTSVPTLGEYGLALLTALLAAVGLVTVRRRR